MTTVLHGTKGDGRMPAIAIGQWKTACREVTEAQKAAWAVLDVEHPPEPCQVMPPPPDQPERLLLRQVLDLSIRDLCPSPRGVKRGRLHRWRQSAEWIASDDEYPDGFSFRSVCHSLGIEPEYIRRLVGTIRCQRCGHGVYVSPCRCVTG